MSSIEPYGGGGEVYSAKEGAGSFIVSRCNGAVLLEFLEKIFDQVSPCVHILIVCALLCAIGFWRDDGFGFGLIEQIKHPLCSIAGFIRQKGFDAL